jgi:hypothetical protein
LSNFDSGDFTVSANGFVALAGGGAIQTLTPDLDFDGSAATPVAPQSGNINFISYNPSYATVTNVLNSTGAATGNMQVEHRAWTTGLVVDPSSTLGSRGTFTTMASAMTAATAGQTVFLRDSITENFTIKANVNIVGWPVSGSNSSPSITGKITMSTAGICTISGIKLITNSDYFLETSGAVSASVTLDKCNLQCTNNTGINQTATSGAVRIQNCNGDITTTGITWFTSTAGTLQISNCPVMANTGGSTTASTKSAGTLFMQSTAMNVPITTSGTAALQVQDCYLAVTNTTCLTHGGSGTVSFIRDSKIDSGTASAISVGASGVLYCEHDDISSSNTNAITGAGSILYGALTFSSSSSVINTTTQTGLYTQLGKYKASKQPAFMAYVDSSILNVTGDGTIYTVIFDTESFDLDSNFDLASSTFTAPVAGVYRFHFGILLGGGTALSATSIRVTTTPQTFMRSISTNSGVTTSASGEIDVLVNLAATNTVTFQVAATDSGGKIDDVNGTTGGVIRTWCHGQLVC